jgi:hypothetical protein
MQDEVRPDSTIEKPQKTAKEITDLLWAALKETNAPGPDDYNIRVFRVKADSSEWNAEIVGKERVVDAATDAAFEKAKLELQQQFELTD